MKTRKKLVSILLAFVLVISLMPTALAAESSYQDTNGHWAEVAIERWSGYGIVEGSNGLFYPDDNMTRGEAAKVFANLLGLTRQASLDGYTDVPADAWYSEYMAKCVAAGILQGDGSGKLNPTEPIKREEMFVMFARALGISPKATSDTQFSDGSQISSWASGYINALADRGIVTGMGGGSLAPREDINRASVMALLDKAIETYVTTDGTTVSSTDGIVLVVADDVTVTGSVDTLVVANSSNTVTVTGGAVENVAIVGPENQVVITGISQAGEVTIPATAEGASVVVDSNATVGNVTSEASNVTISGSGTVENAQVSGDNTAVNTDGTDLTVAEGTTGVTENTKPVAGGESVTTKNTSSGGSSSGGSSTSSHSHSWGEGVVTTEATCTTNGVKTFTCACGETKTESIPALGHSYGEWTPNNDGTHSKVCTRCNDKVTESCTWNYTQDADHLKHTKTCSVCGASVTEPCTFDATTGKCECGIEKPAVAGDPEASIGTTGYATLEEAIIVAQSGATILLRKDIVVEAQVTIPNGVTINGDGKKISVGTGSWSETNGYKHLLAVEGGTAAISNVQLDSKNLAYGVNVYESADVTLTNVTIVNSKGSGLTVNSSTVTASGLNISGSGWSYSVNVDANTSTAASFTMTGTNTLSDPCQIKSDNYSADKVTVNADGYYMVVPETGTLRLWTTTPEAVSEAKIDNTYYAAAETAFGAASTSVTITLVNDAEITLDSPDNRGAIELTTDNLTIDGNGKTLTTNAAGIYIQKNLTKLTIKDLTLKAAMPESLEGIAGETRYAWMGIGTYNKDVTIGELSLTGVTIDGFGYGMYFGLNTGSAQHGTTKLMMDGCTVTNCFNKGIYAENLNASTISNSTFTNNGHDAANSFLPDHAKTWIAGIDINLKFGDYQDINITGCTFTGNGADNGGALMLKARGTGNDSSYAASPATLTNVTVSGCTFSDNNLDIVLGEKDKLNTSPAKVTITGYDTAGNAKFQDNRGLALAGLGTEAKPYEIGTVAELKSFRDAVNSGSSFSGVFFKLTSDIDLNNEAWTPIGPNADAANKFQGTFDGNNKTISNLKVDTATGGAQYQATGFFGALNGTVKNLTIDGATITGMSAPNAQGNTDNGIAVVAGSIYTSGTIEGVTVKNATVTGNRYVAGIAGYVYSSVKNCTVENVTLTATPDNLNGSYDNGDKVGGVVGAFWHENTYEISGNTAENVTITGYRDMGGIVGYANGRVTNNTVNGLTLIQDYSILTDPRTTVEAIIGRHDGFEVDSSNTATNVTIAVSTPKQLSAALNKTYTSDTTIKLANDIDLADKTWDAHVMTVNNGINVTLDGNGKTIYALNTTALGSASGFSGCGLIAGVVSGNNAGEAGTLTVKNLTVNNATVSVNGSACVAAILGTSTAVNLVFDGCAVNGAQISSGAYAAGLVGYVQTIASVSVSVKDCTITGSTFTGNDATGALVGLNNGSTTITGATVTGNTINGGAGYSAAALVGTSIGGTTATGVTASGNTFSITNTTGYQVNDATYGYLYKNSQTYSVNGTELN